MNLTRRFLFDSDFLFNFTHSLWFNSNKFYDQIQLPLHTFHPQSNLLFHIYRNCESHLQLSIPTKKVIYFHHLRGGRINVALMMVVEVVMVLGPPTYSPRKLIFGLMVVILCHLKVSCLQYHFDLGEIKHHPYWMI